MEYGVAVFIDGTWMLLHKPGKKGLLILPYHVASTMAKSITYYDMAKKAKVVGTQSQLFERLNKQSREKISITTLYNRFLGGK